MRYLLMSKLIQFHINNEAQNFIFFILKVGTRLTTNALGRGWAHLQLTGPKFGHLFS